MARTQLAEVGAIERRELRLVKAFDDREEGGIDEADVGVGVSIAELPDAGVVRRQEVGDDIGTRFDVAEQCDQNAGMKALLYPVVDLDEDRRRDHQRLFDLLDQGPTGHVIRVGAIEGGIERTRIQDQRHERGSGR